MNDEHVGLGLVDLNAERAQRVDRVHAIFARKKSVNRQTPLDKAAMMAARCEMLLSPGTVISVSIRGARFTRSSIGSVPKFRTRSARRK